jgi:type IV secretion system protein TrbI
MNESIQDKAPKPPGLLPRNVQSWLIVGLALLMVFIMWLTGAKRPPLPSKSNAVVPGPVPVEVNQAKIAELQNRIQQLQREQTVAESALAQQGRYLSTPTEAGPTNGPSNSPQGAEDAIDRERRKRAYLSLFASNVAVTYRKNPLTGFAGPSDAAGSPEARPAITLAPQPENPQITELLKQMQPPPSQAPPVTSSPPSTPAGSVEADHKAKEGAHPATPAANAASGRSYVLFEGTVLESVLANRLDGSMSGPVECLTTNDVYSHDRQRLLIPAGSKVLGETRHVEAFGQVRLAVIFHRLVMPDGYSVSLDEFKGLNQVGDVGLHDQVNNHYVRIFGASLALGLIGAAAEAGTAGALTESGTDRLREGFGQSMALSSEHLLDRFLNLLPTITIREGHRVKIYLSSDLALPDYANHNLPSDL